MEPPVHCAEEDYCSDERTQHQWGVRSHCTVQYSAVQCSLRCKGDDTQTGIRVGYQLSFSPVLQPVVSLQPSYPRVPPPPYPPSADRYRVSYTRGVDRFTVGLRHQCLASSDITLHPCTAGHSCRLLYTIEQEPEREQSGMTVFSRALSAEQ